MNRKLLYEFYLLNCLHFEWARINLLVVTCPQCGEPKPVVIGLGRKWK